LALVWRRGQPADPLAGLLVESCLSTFRRIEESPLPVIAAVNGLAIGGGFELALACDIVIASETAFFSMPEVEFGVAPGFGVLRVADILGRHWGKYLLMTGDRLTAEEGIQARVCPAGHLHQGRRNARTR
jgi:enoyl-CoA hydratase/carnithine racemase